MKKLKFTLGLIIASALIIFTSCSKDDENDVTTTPAVNGALIDGMAVTKTADPVMTDKTVVLETTAGKFELEFSTKPTESGTYTLKPVTTSSKLSTATTKEVYFRFTDKNNVVYKFSDGIGGTVSIVIKDGKMTIDISNISVCNAGNCKKVSVKYDFPYTPPTTSIDPNPVDQNPTTDLAVNTFKIGNTVYKTDAVPGWHGFNGYLGYSGGIGNQFKALFSEVNPKSGTYKVVTKPLNGQVAAGEIGIDITIGYFPKPVSSNTGKATVINEKGQLTIIVSDVTIGNEKFSAHYVIGDKNRHIFVDGVSLQPTYNDAYSEGESKSVHKTRIKTYGTSTAEQWGFVFYFGASGLNDGTYTGTALNTNLGGIPSGTVVLIADNGYIQYKSTASSGTITVKDKKIFFTDFTITNSAGKVVKITGEYQF